MIINHNLNAMNAHRNMGINTVNSGKSMEKLASGLRINRAGDDAAGLAISEKMRGQIRGLDQAARNSQDGISMIQTAEGALNETHSILQRMRELAVQSSNDTNTGVDRTEIQKEINQLTSEINRIGSNTEFNTQKLLNGNKTGAYSAGGPIPEIKSSVTIGTLEITSKLVGIAGDAQDVVFVAGVGNNQALSVNYAANVLTITLGTDAGGLLDGTKNTNTLIAAAIAGNGAANAAFSVDAGTGTDVQATPGTHNLTGGQDAGTAVAKDGAAYLQIGANNAQQFKVEIGDMRAANLGIAAGAGAAFATDSEALTDATTGTEYALDIRTAAKATAAINIIDLAVKSVSSERSKLGAFQNRLEHTIANLGTASENLTSAESRIRDVDMAKEMMAFSKNNILSQAAQAMLAQANQQPQGVLQLLR